MIEHSLICVKINTLLQYHAGEASVILIETIRAVVDSNIAWHHIKRSTLSHQRVSYPPLMSLGLLTASPFRALTHRAHFREPAATKTDSCAASCWMLRVAHERIAKTPVNNELASTYMYVMRLHERK